MARRRLTDEEFEAACRAQDKWHEQNPDPQPQGVSGWYDAARRRVMIEMDNGCLVGLPISLFPGTERATDEQLARLEVDPEDGAVIWEELNAGNDVGGTILRALEIKAWAGRYLGTTLVPPPEPPGVALEVDDDDPAAPAMDERDAAD